MPDQAPSGPWIYLLPMIGLAMIVLRNRRARRLRVEWLWVSPLVLVALTALVFSIQPPPGPALLGLDVTTLALGGVAGWWRGRFTHIAVDPATHALTSRSSPAGMLLILALFAVRYGLRTLEPQTAGLLHVSALELTDGLMLLAVGLVTVQRLEIAIRARRLLGQARAARP
jgi:hypothetical protein